MLGQDICCNTSQSCANVIRPTNEAWVSFLYIRDIQKYVLLSPIVRICNLLSLFPYKTRTCILWHGVVTGSRTSKRWAAGPRRRFREENKNQKARIFVSIYSKYFSYLESFQRFRSTREYVYDWLVGTLSDFVGHSEACVTLTMSTESHLLMLEHLNPPSEDKTKTCNPCKNAEVDKSNDS